MRSTLPYQNATQSIHTIYGYSCYSESISAFSSSLEKCQHHLETAEQSHLLLQLRMLSTLQIQFLTSTWTWKKLPPYYGFINRQNKLLATAVFKD